MTDFVSADGRYVSEMEEWIHCPDCGESDVWVNVGYDGDYQVACPNCEAWGSYLP